MEINELTEIVIGCAIEVHRTLGPGLLESAYQQCLFYELKTHNLYVEREIKLPIIYKDMRIDHGYRIDLLIENKLVIELKTVEKFTDVHTAQNINLYEIGRLFNRIIDKLQYKTP